MPRFEKARCRPQSSTRPRANQKIESPYHTARQYPLRTTERGNICAFSICRPLAQPTLAQHESQKRGQLAPCYLRFFAERRSVPNNSAIKGGTIRSNRLAILD